MLTAGILVAALAAAAAQAELNSHERENGAVVATCSSLTFYFKGFPNAPNNTVFEKITIKQEGVSTTVYEGMFSFDGPEGSNTIPITVPAGPTRVDGFASWNTNGFKGGYDITWSLNCSAPAFTIEKLQRIQGSGEPFTKELLLGHVGETIEYEVIVKDTGNTPLTFQNFIDKRCTNITGGPPGQLSPGQEATYFCSHTLVPEDLVSTSYSNQASVTGVPPKGFGSKKTLKSNIVQVVFPRNEHGTEEVTCKSITFKFIKFPNALNNTVHEKVTVNKVVVYEGTFTFNGPSGSNTIPITVPPGAGTVDGFAAWNTNGFKGGFDLTTPITCTTVPALGLEKLQRVGQEAVYTTGTVAAKEGETLEYEVVATNEGNVPLTLGSLQDPRCEEVTGGPGASPLEPGQSTTYTCRHTVDAEDALAGFYDNSAELTGSYEAKNVSAASNTVEATITQ